MKRIFFIFIIISTFILTSCQEQEVNIPGVGMFQIETYSAKGEGMIATINPIDGLIIENVSTIPPSSNIAVWISGSEIWINTPDLIKEVTVNFSWNNFPEGQFLNLAVKNGTFFQKPLALLTYDPQGRGYLKVEDVDLVPAPTNNQLAPSKTSSLSSFLFKEYSISLKQNRMEIVDKNNLGQTIVSTIPSLKIGRKNIRVPWGSLKKEVGR